MQPWFVLLFVSLVTILASLPSDPYLTLGLARSAKPQEIKRAYKNLAKEWHPDKNTSPEASDRFMEISKAYEILSDPLKKERFDKFGMVDDGGNTDAGRRQPYGFDPFFGGFGFGGYDSGKSFFSTQRVSIRQYTFSLVEKSYEKPFLLFAYSGYCQLCFRLESLWEKVHDSLEPLGYGFGTVNAMTDGNLLDKLRVSRLPSIIALVEGRAIHFRGDFHRLTEKSIRMFARDVIPDSFILRINTYDKLKRFIDQSRPTNKVAVLILGAKPEPLTRYSLAAMRLSRFARFAYVHLGESSHEIENMAEAMSIKCTVCENVLLFNDFPEEGPIARLSTSKADEFSRETLDNLLNKNRFLVLPRIASQSYMDGVCTVSSRSYRQLCVLLLAVDQSDPLTESFRRFAKRSAPKYDSLKFAYVSATSQKAFLRPYLEKRSGDIENNRRDVLILWRLEAGRARFALLEGVWAEGEAAEREFVRRIQAFASGDQQLEQAAVIANLVDEQAPSWFVAFSRRVMRLLENAWFELSKEEAYPVLSAAASFLVILLIGFLLSHVTSEKKKPPQPFRTESEKREEREWHPEDPRSGDGEEDALRLAGQKRMQRVVSTMRPLMHELRAESQFGMIRLLKPGCRSLILLTDKDNKERLIEQFACAIYPLRNNRTFSFGFLMVEKNLPWFIKLLEHTLPIADQQPNAGPSMCQKLKTQINPKQTIGTVLVLCGWKLYFSIYHPMHTAGKRKNFLGFEDDGDSESDGSGEEAEGLEVNRKAFKPNVQNVLNGLPNWLDRLLEGSIRRYYIPEWPDNLV